MKNFGWLGYALDATLIRTAFMASRSHHVLLSRVEGRRRCSFLRLSKMSIDFLLVWLLFFSLLDSYFIFYFFKGEN